MKTHCFLWLIVLNMMYLLSTPHATNQINEDSAHNIISLPTQDTFAGTFASSSIAWLPDSESFLVGVSGAIWRYDKNMQDQPKLLVTIPGLSDTVVTVNPEGTLVALGSLSYSEVLLWEYPSLNLLEKIETGSEHVTNLQFSPDGTLLAIASSDTSSDGMFYWNYRIQIWDVTQQKEQIVLRAGVPHAPNIEFLNANHQLLVAGRTWGYDSNTSIIQLWDLETLTASTPFPQQPLSITPMVQANWVVVAGLTKYRTNEIWIWDIETSNKLQNIPVEADQITTLALSHDFKLLAIANTSGTIHLWNIETETMLAALEGHTDYVDKLVFSPDDKSLVSSSFDGTIRIWGMETFAEVATIPIPTP
jgi:WD40 repeat protein